MRVFMIGEAANHAHRLRAALPDLDVVGLPREAAYAPDHDSLITPGDAVIALRFSRPAGTVPAFRLLHVPGAGTDGIDFAALPPSAWVCNVYEHEGPIAEFALASMLEWEIGLCGLRAGFSAAAWPELYRNRAPHGELNGRTLGLIGFGRIGREVARRAQAFGMHVVAVRGRPGPPDDCADEAFGPDGLHQVLARADYLVIACPLDPATRGMIGAAELAAMKPGAVLVNVSRAEVIDEKALFRALEERRIRGASLDVWYRYPDGTGDRVAPSRFPFHRLENAVCTPHVSAWTTALPERRYALIANNLRRLVSGEPLLNVVRSPVPTPPFAA